MPAGTADIKNAAELLRSGRLVAFPTETVYGLGADAANPAAIELIYATKGRPGTNPLIVHVPDVSAARKLVTQWPESAERLAERFWPGPLTIILPKARGPGSIPDNATAGLGTLALRVPNHPLALTLLREFDGPLAAPSANRSTRVSPTTARHVRDEFPDSVAAGGTSGEPSLILDGGPCDVGIESTVLDLTGEPTILRPGRVRPDELVPIIGAVRTGTTPSLEGPAKSPGQQEVHYAPRAKSYSFPSVRQRVVAGALARDRSAVLLLGDAKTSRTYPENHGLRRAGWLILMPDNPEEYARVLYKTLRELDERMAEAIYIEMPPAAPEWAAVRDRLTRATVPLRLM